MKLAATTCGIAVVVVCGLAPIRQVCGQPISEPPEISKYPVLDSRIAFGGLLKEIVWLDNDRVTFFGRDQEKLVSGKPFPEYERPSDPKRAGDTLYWDDQFIWNVKTGSIQRPSRPMRKLCVYGKSVTYMSQSQSDDPALYWYYGVLGNEKRLPVSEKHWINPHSCRFYTTSPTWVTELAKRNHKGKPLLERDGYLDTGAPDNVTWKDVVLVSPKPQWQQKELPRLSGAAWSVKYIVHADAYLLYDFKAPPQAVLLKPDGDLDVAQFPAKSPRNNGPLSYTRLGFFYHNIDGRNNVEDLTRAGGYVLTGDRLERIVVGWIQAEGVSPDGCKIAFSHARSAKAHYDGLENRRRGGLGNTTVKMIDLCQKGT